MLYSKCNFGENWCLSMQSMFFEYSTGRKNCNRRAFTLAETLIALVIIGIIAAVFD